MNRLAWRVFLGLLPLTTLATANDLKQIPSTSASFRRPIAMKRIDESTALVANRNGTLSVVDFSKRSVVAEFAVGGRLSDLDGGGQHFLVTDTERSRLLAIDVDRTSANVVWQLKLPAHPASVRISGDRRWCSVCLLWARKVVIVRLPNDSAAENSPKVVASVDLPFAPREQLHVRDQSRVIVADAFSGRLAVVETESHRIEALHAFTASNIRGLALNRDGDRLLVSHQVLNELAVPRRTDIIWGVTLDNGLRSFRLEKVLTPGANVTKDSRFISLGYGSQGAGDPDSLFVDKQGRTVVAVAGVSEIVVIESNGQRLRRIPVGRRPIAVMSVGKEHVLVANQLSDSVSLVDLSGDADYSTQSPSAQTESEADNNDRYASGGAYRDEVSGYRDSAIVKHIRLGPTPEPSPSERGEFLFFDARLSHANWFSCHSCHTDGHSNGGLADTFGDGSDGAPKRILSLLGVSETGPWAWNGSKQSLTDQVHQSVRSTMQSRKLSDENATRLVAFLKTLKPPPPFQPAVSPKDEATIEQGRQLFDALNCKSCHQGRTLTSSGLFDVGLSDRMGMNKYNPPSLRGVGHRYGLFHDKRAKNVEDVVIRFQHQLPRRLERDEQRTLVRYLNSL